MARTAQEINSKSADRLKQLCHDLDISQTKLAELSGLTTNTLSKIATGKSPLTHYVATCIVEAFPMYRTEWLEGLDDDPTLTGDVFIRSAIKAKKQSEILHSAFISIASLCGYSVATVRSDIQAANAVISNAPTGYNLSKGRRTVFLSDDEMVTFEHEISDLIELKLRHLFARNGGNNG